jgi:adenylate cyclase
VISLESLEACFQGQIPSAIATVNSSRVTNATYISKVHHVDPERVALSNQFMSKTVRNIADNPKASVLLTDPFTYEQFRLQLVFERSETRGKVFDRLSDEIDEIAAIEGVTSKFKLQSADIFRVREIQQLPTLGKLEQQKRIRSQASPSWKEAIKIVETISRASSNELALQLAQTKIMQVFENARVNFYALKNDGVLVNIATNEQIPMGQGLIGTAALRAETLVMDNLLVASRYAKSVGNTEPEQNPIKSALVTPLISKGEVVGVISVTGEIAAAFGEEEKFALQTISAALAPVVGNKETPLPKQAEQEQQSLTVRFYQYDGSVFIGDDYLVRGLSGEVFAHMVQSFISSGKDSFTNRELRMAPDLQIPGLRDNLESRIHTLLQRLSERDAGIRLERQTRGRYQLRVDGELSFEVISSH